MKPWPNALNWAHFHTIPHLDYIDRELVGALHKADVYVFPWNINDAGDIQHAFSMGVDGLIAKDPLLVRQCCGDDRH